MKKEIKKKKNSQIFIIQKQTKNIYLEHSSPVCEGNYEIVIAGDWYRDYYRTRLVSILNNNGLKQSE